MKFGSITTGRVSDGLVFNMDAANRVSYVPYATHSFDTIDSSISGSLYNHTSFDPSYNGYWDFDGTDDYILVAPDSSGPLHDIGTGDFTIEAWASYTNASGYRWIIGAWHLADGLLFGRSNTGEFACYIDSNTEIYSTFDVPITGDWTNYVMTRLNDNVSMYANGVPAGGPFSKPGTLSAATEFRIGDRDGYAQDWIGKISNIHIYNRALSSNEVLHNYNALKGRFT